MCSLIDVDIDKLMESFSLLEKNIVDVKEVSNIMEDKMDDTSRMLRWSLARERCLVRERDGLLATMKSLQQCLQEQCNLRVVNERLKDEVMELKQEIKRTLEAQEAEVERLASQMDAEEERHQGELMKRQSKLEEKDAEMKKLLQQKESELETMREKFLDQEKERQNELLRMQIEFGAKLAKAQSMAQRNQQPQSSSHFPHIYKRKLMFFQEEKNKEIDALRQRIKELEGQQRARSSSDNCLKRRKI